MDHIIEVRNVWKRFQLRRDRADSVGQLLVRLLPTRRPRVVAEPFVALRDVSFAVPRGQSLGVIGHNGAGKSTMLKILSRTMQPTSGSVAVRGKVSALIELGAGFHPDFTGRENIVLNASLLGIPRREISRRMSAIIEFAEIGQFIDTPVKYYSSGMYARLGFSVAVHVEPEILIVDEVLSVGDEAFQRKCMQRIFEMKRRGISILLVSHGLASIEELMDEAVWIDHGEVRAGGRPHDVVTQYRERVAAVQETAASSAGASAQPPVGGPVLLRAVTWQAGSPEGEAEFLASGQPVRFAIDCDNTAGEPLQVHAAVEVRRADGLCLAELTTVAVGEPLHLPADGGRLLLQCGGLPLADGTYDIDVTVTAVGSARPARWPGAAHLPIRTPVSTSGVCVLPYGWTLDPLASPMAAGAVSRSEP